ncbi:unnamed protein product [Cuscuta campestris]|uniref:Uncharacterized protein n=1 Tax=Cuscuta campestris TaxID=132261 RepID=A0A484NAZ8_9ASTE|nr:unnamed protein product [Cuscuta campestris]
MGISSEDFRTCLWIFLEFSTRLCFGFVMEHPLHSLVFLIFIIFYLFFSSLFWFLIYSFPLFLISGVVVLAIYRPGTGDDARTENRVDIAEEEVGKKKKKFVGRARSVRRRRSKKDFQPYVEEEGVPIFLPPGFCDEHRVFDKSSLTEEEEKEEDEEDDHMKDIREVVEVQGGDLQVKPADSFRRSSGDDSEKSQEEWGRRSKGGGVQWTTTTAWDHDQKKNPMDLSEMERNKRLESLMARRRARRLVSIHVRRTLMNLGSDDPPISVVIPRTNSSGSSNGGLFSPGSGAPGSAPSVMLPNRNPFDLPYDQHEEKPNLSGGSFQQDFMVPHQDFVFCRHESFTLGAASASSFFADFNSDDDLHLHKVFEASENYKSTTPYGKGSGDNKLIEQEPLEEPEKLNDASTSDVKEAVSTTRCEEDNGEVQIKSVLIEDTDMATSSSSSSSSSAESEDEAFYRIDKDAILKSLATPPAPRNQKARMDENYFFATFAKFPTPSHSIASDLQVEVSELGSPPRSVDGTSSSLEEENDIFEPFKSNSLDKQGADSDIFEASEGPGDLERSFSPEPGVQQADVQQVCNADSFEESLETERLSKPEIITHYLESDDHLLKMDSDKEETERLSESEKPALNLESYDRDESHVETSTKSHRNGLVVQEEG